MSHSLPVRRTTRPRTRATVTACGLLALAIGGCTLPGADPSASPSANSLPRATLLPDSPATPRGSATPSSSPTPEAALVLKPVVHQPLADPAGFVAPACARPSTVFSWEAMSPAGLAAARRFGDVDRLKAGTNHSAAASAWAHPAAQVQGWLEGTTPQPTDRKIAFLTFDDGPTGVTTPQVLQILRQKGAHATFFTVGREVNPTSAGILREAVAEGNAVAIHSYGHDYHYLYPHGRASVQNLGCDISWADATLKAALGSGYTTHAFRYPGGHMSWKSLAPVDAAQAAKGRHWIDWNAMTGDADATMPNGTPAQQRHNITRRQGKAAVGRNVLVVLAHDYFPNREMVGALPGIIDDLRAQGYEFGIIE